jgi:predicted short-subunit dehydrogenase-like oxidoreductase (DUF2520 family)
MTLQKLIVSLLFRCKLGFMNVVMIGSGNVAWHLAPALENIGHKVTNVYSPNIGNAKSLTKRLYEAQPTDSLDFSNNDPTLFIIAINDHAIEDVTRELILPEEAIVAHTSGSKSLNTLEYVATEHIGDLYPLQTFSKAKKIDFKDIPLLIESEDNYTKNTLLKIAGKLSKVVREVHSDDRKALHVSAVFACNLTNHLFTISEKLLANKKLDFNLLKPLITETINKSLEIGPQNAQTGPAIREDTETLENHMQYLESNEDYAAIYRLITQNIIDTYTE